MFDKVIIDWAENEISNLKYCKISDHFSTRLDGGLAYKAPTVFTEDAERIQFRNVLPIDVAHSKAERIFSQQC